MEKKEGPARHSPLFELLLESLLICRVSKQTSHQINPHSVQIIERFYALQIQRRVKYLCYTYSHGHTKVIILRNVSSHFDIRDKFV